MSKEDVENNDNTDDDDDIVRKETEDGYESQLATNYIGHFLLTHLLLPAITRTAADTRTDVCRIINVSSIAHYMG